MSDKVSNNWPVSGTKRRWIDRMPGIEEQLT